MPKLSSFFTPSVPKKTQDQHDRKRTVPHQVNSWATYVYFQGIYLLVSFYTLY